MSASKEPPRLPEIQDEAGDTPSWVPLLGLGLLCLVALLIAARQAVHKDSPKVAGDAGAEQAAAAPEKAAPAPAPGPVPAK